MSYFVAKPQPDSRGGDSVPTTPIMPRGDRQSSTEDAETGEDDTEFMDFTFQGLSNLYKRNLQLVRAETSPSTDRSNSEAPARRPAGPNILVVDEGVCTNPLI